MLSCNSPYSSEAEHQSRKLGVVSSILTGGIQIDHSMVCCMMNGGLAFCTRSLLYKRHF